MNQWLLIVIQSIIRNASPEIINGLRSAILEWYTKAKATPNPWDDILPSFLLMMLGDPED